jgi:hypothetical protein
MTPRSTASVGILGQEMLTIEQFNAKQARREAQKAAKQDNELKKQIQNVSSPPSSLSSSVPTHLTAAS